MKLPPKNRWIQPNNSDKFGSVWYTKNINFDEEGYAKPSSRVISIASESVDSFVGRPLSFGRNGSGSFYVVTSDDPLITDLSTLGYSVIEDTDTGGGGSPPATNTQSAGRWWQDRWYVSTTGGTNGLKYKTQSNGNWTAVSLSLTTTAAHPLEVFTSRQTMCIGDGNTVKQIDTSHSSDTTLTLPPDYEVIGLSYSFNKMGIITRLGEDSAGVNGDAFFFVWSGSTEDAQSGVPIGSDSAVAITAYQGTWVILTRTGQLLKYTGAGFTELASLPFYFQDKIWGDFLNRVGTGDMMKVEGDTILINLGFDFSNIGESGEINIQNCPSGVWCYDPKVGLYHKYSPSISLGVIKTVSQANVNTTTDLLTCTATVPETGSPAIYTFNDNESIGGLKLNHVYYVIKFSATTFKLAETRADAFAGNYIDLTSQGGTTHRFLLVGLKDYGQSYTGRTGGIELMGQKTSVYDHVIFGANVREANGTGYENLCISVDGLPNRAYLVTPRIDSTGMKDSFQRVSVKYAPLASEEKIIVKAKTKDAVGLPLTTPQLSESTDVTVEWVDNTTFTTEYDLSAVVDYLALSENNQCEVEIISGAGGGQMAQISSISENVGIYTVVLAEQIEGVVTGDLCEIIIDNWKKLGEITSSDPDGFKIFSVGENAKFIKYKIEMRGSGVKIEEIQTSETINQAIQ